MGTGGLFFWFSRSPLALRRFRSASRSACFLPVPKGDDPALCAEGNDIQRNIQPDNLLLHHPQKPLAHPDAEWIQQEDEAEVVLVISRNLGIFAKVRCIFCGDKVKARYRCTESLCLGQNIDASYFGLKPTIRYNIALTVRFRNSHTRTCLLISCSSSLVKHLA